MTTTETPPTEAAQFSAAELAQFDRDGYLIVRGMVTGEVIDRMRETTWEHLAREIPPIEFEAETEYPGAPASLAAAGGRTARRLKQALGRGQVFIDWLSDANLSARLEQLLGSPVLMPLAHHNCIMTKQPQYSSDTGWHQDIRYWSFEKPELISVWVAVTEERPENGSLRLIPGSHKWELPRERFDDALFLREDLAENESLFDAVTEVALEPGDVLLFHCRTFHSASRNSTSETKLSAVFTFRGADNSPLPHSRSTSLPELQLRSGG